MSTLRGLIAISAVCGLTACEAPISRSDTKLPIALENGMPMLDACLRSKTENFGAGGRAYIGETSQMGIIARSMGAAGPNCHVFFATHDSRGEVMTEINKRGDFVGMVEVPGGQLAMYKQRGGSRYFLMTEPSPYRQGGEFYEALVVLQDPT